MTERKQEHAYPFASINDERNVRNAAKGIARGLGFNKTIMRQSEVRLFGPCLTASTLDRNPEDLLGIWAPCYQINSSVVNSRAFKAMARKQIQHYRFTEITSDFRMS